MEAQEQMPDLAPMGRPHVYPWYKLQKKGDFFCLSNADAKKSKSCRESARKQGLKVKIRKTVTSGYVVVLREDRGDIL